MNDLNQPTVQKRSYFRRKEDRQLFDEIRRHQKIFHMGQMITSVMSMNTLFERIIEQTNQIMGTERTTVFLYDERLKELWALVATDMKTNEVRIPCDFGVVGSVFQKKAPLIINDAYNDPRFYPEVDQGTGFRTKNILCIPLVNRKGRCIGALQALNKKSENFTDEDLTLLLSISHYVAIALENSKLYEEVKGYSEELEATLLRIDALERIKSQLTKFVPSSVAKMAENAPEKLSYAKEDMDVTILFIDIIGFTRITAELGHRLVNDMIECHFSKYLECIYRHGGEVNETSGDGLMVIFKNGAIEDNARKAVAAGLEIIAENRRLNDGFFDTWGKVDLHLGINSGKALVGSTKMKTLAGERWTYTASGLATVFAARIGKRSSKTQLYVGSDTFQYIKNFYDCEDKGCKKFKDIKEPIYIYNVRKVRENVAI